MIFLSLIPIYDECMRTIRLTDEEFELLSVLLSAEVEAMVSYTKLTRALFLRFNNGSARIKTLQADELSATATIKKSAKRRGRPPKKKVEESIHPVSLKDLEFVRLEDDFINRTSQIGTDDRYMKNRRRGRNYRAFILERMRKPTKVSPIPGQAASPITEQAILPNPEQAGPRP